MSAIIIEITMQDITKLVSYATHHKIGGQLDQFLNKCPEKCDVIDILSGVRGTPGELSWFFEL